MGEFVADRKISVATGISAVGGTGLGAIKVVGTGEGNTAIAPFSISVFRIRNTPVIQAPITTKMPAMHAVLSRHVLSLSLREFIDPIP